MRLRIPIGISDFRELRDKRLEYVDKSSLLVEMIDREGTKVLLLPRPRRFGKTLNLSMIRYYFERRAEDLSYLFEDLAVWRAGEEYRRHFQRYPVIFLSFRNVRANTFEMCWSQLCRTIQTLYAEHRELLDGDSLTDVERQDFLSISSNTAEPVLYERALEELSKYLHRVTGERVIILIDEYDAPIHAGYLNGYGGQIIDFFRGFLTSGLKDNPHLERGVVTGILRIARESIFSGLNHLGVYTLLDKAFGTSFGFTEPEVERLLDRAGMMDHREVARDWYIGYLFGGTVIFNPWSVLNFVDRDGDPQPYWLNTSSNDLIHESLRKHGVRLQPALEQLLAGESVDVVLDADVVLNQLDESEVAFWSLLVFSGYLEAEKRGDRRARVSIPNREVRLVYTSTFQQWLNERMRGHGADQQRMLHSLFGGDAETLELQIGALVKNVLSYHDLGPDEPERFYQAFILGLLCTLEPGHRVRSNRESGKGRPDVQIFPNQPGQPGVVLELKVARGKRTLEQVLEEGIEQARTKDYTAEVTAVGADPVHVFVVAFDGKDVRVVAVEGL